MKDIAAALGILPNAVYQLRYQYGLPKREKVHVEPETPTPEEIAERARECREAHYARRRAETDEQVWSKVSQRRRRELA